MRRQGVYAAAHADQKSCEKHYGGGGGAGRAERVCAAEFSHDGDIGHIEEHLQYVREHERQGKEHNAFP